MWDGKQHRWLKLLRTCHTCYTSTRDGGSDTPSMSDDTQSTKQAHAVITMEKLTRGTHRVPYYGWVLMVVLGVTTIISYGTTQYLFGVLVVPMHTTFQWSQASLS